MTQPPDQTTTWPGNPELREMLAKCPTAQRIWQEGGKWSEIALALWRERDVLAARVEELEAIAPKAYRSTDGVVSVWHCPDNLIPVTDLSTL